MSLLLVEPLVEPQEHVNGRTIVGRADPGDRTSIAESEFDTIPGPNEPPDPVRPSRFNNFATDTGVPGNGYSGKDTPEIINDSSVSLAWFINPYAKHGQRDFFNENVGVPTGKPAVIADNRGRLLDDRTQYPGQQLFRYDTNISRPPAMTFSDLLDQEGIYY